MCLDAHEKEKKKKTIHSSLIDDTDLVRHKKQEDV